METVCKYLSWNNFSTIPDTTSDWRIQIMFFGFSFHMVQGESEGDIPLNFGENLKYNWKLCIFVHLLNKVYPKNMYYILLKNFENLKLTNFVHRFRKFPWKICIKMIIFFFRVGEILQNINWFFHYSWLKDTCWKIQITLCLFLFTWCRGIWGGYPHSVLEKLWKHNWK